MNYTNKLKLRMPLPTEEYNIEHQNENMRILDEVIGKVPFVNDEKMYYMRSERAENSAIDANGNIVENADAVCHRYDLFESGEFDLYVSGACSQTFPLYVIKAADGNMISMGWSNGETSLTVGKEYFVVVPENAAFLYINQLKANEFLTDAVVKYSKKFEVGEEDLSEDFKKNTRKTFSNALKGTASGAVVRLDDVSPIEHKVECRVQSKNLIPYPYAYTDGVKGGAMEVSTDENGVITLNGTTEKATTLYLSLNTPNLKPNTTYTLSGLTGITETQKVQIAVRAIKGSVYVSGDGITTASVWVDKASTFTTVSEGDSRVDCYAAYVFIPEGVQLENVTIHPMLEEGSVATEWVPYIDVSGTSIKVQGKNLLPYPFVSSDVTSRYGVTFTDHGDGSLYIKGTPTSNIYYELCSRENPFFIPANTYITISGIKTSAWQNGQLVLIKVNESGTAMSDDTMMGTGVTTTKTILIEESGNYYLRFIVQKDYATNYIISPMVEIGTSFNGYESYVNPVEYTVPEDGIVDNIAPVFTNMILTTETQNVVLSVKYNKDINKAFEELYNAIISLGGNV